ncbi:hypothetical protein ACFZBM_35015 [Streptomyces lavendulae]|uniref:Uncharacterized protein n=1 Tax=Streptomyces lavendulae subsp. lavendulae TaxID=58340 RepID=A0A2K8PAH0_STRLA|nr:hypothetical protein [Streptomyces lavendulae]ATZ23727.1 hypothetical protein SLAV_09290 [Streptomyces lavendulae subsp. lavendulae]QUQ53559.1 hypothetical protein SLLC_07320 [Streptomyces lavendulae subsp. lavendulae]
MNPRAARPAGRRAGGRRGGVVKARFRFGEVPGVTLAPSPSPATGLGPATGRSPGPAARPARARAGATASAARAARAAACAAASRALAEAGLGHLGGRLELRTYGPAPGAPRLTRAARRAVAVALTARPRP